MKTPLIRATLGMALLLAAGTGYADTLGGAAAGAAQGTTARATDVPPDVDPSVSGKATQAGKPVGSPDAVDAQADGAITSGTCMKGGQAVGAVTKAGCTTAGGTWHQTTISGKGVPATHTETSGGAAKKTTP